jgi:hypothetical protein
VGHEPGAPGAFQVIFRSSTLTYVDSHPVGTKIGIAIPVGVTVPDSLYPDPDPGLCQIRIQTKNVSKTYYSSKTFLGKTKNRLYFAQ